MAQSINTGGMAGGAADLRRIRTTLSAWNTRLRLQQSMAWLPRGLAAGLVLAILTAVAARIWPLMLPTALIRLAVLLAGAGALLVLLVVWLRPRTPLALARRFDVQFGLKERLSTALELSDGALPVESGVLVAAQQVDAARVIDDVNLRQQMPIRADWHDWALAGAALLLFAAAVIYPNPQQDVLAQQAEVEQVIAEQLEELEALREQALEDPALSEDQRAELIEELDDLVETLSQEDITREEAFAALDEAQRDLQELNEQTAEERREQLQGAGNEFGEAGMDSVAEQLEQGDFESAGEELSQMLDEDMSSEEAAGQADQFDQLADSLEDIDPALAESLRDAAESLREGDVSGAQQALEDAGQELADAGEVTSADLSEYAAQLAESGAKVGKAGEPGSGSQPGQGQMGQAQAGGQGQGQQGEGGGPSSGTDPGQVAGDTPRGGGAPDGGMRDADIYAPQRIGGEGGDQVDIPGDPDSVPIQEGEFADNPTGDSTVPYSEVYGDYSETVNEALESGHIPLGMRGLIQQYFSRLDPSQ